MQNELGIVLAPAATLLLCALILLRAHPHRWVGLIGLLITSGAMILAHNNLDLLPASLSLLEFPNDALPLLWLTTLLILTTLLADPTAIGRQYSYGFLLASGAALALVNHSFTGFLFSLFIFDLISAAYWLPQGRPNLFIARVAVAIGTVSSLGLADLLAPFQPEGVMWLLSGLLWMRLAFFPLLALIHLPNRWASIDVVHAAFQLLVTSWLMSGLPIYPLPSLAQWSVVLFLFGQSLLIWLSDNQQANLIRIPFIQLGALLLINASVTNMIVVGAGVALALCLLSLSLTKWEWSPALIPAGLASISLLGLPLTLGQTYRATLYTNLSQTRFLFAAIIVIEMIALGYLARQWYQRWQHRADGPNSDIVWQNLLSQLPLTLALLPGVGLWLTQLLSQQSVAWVIDGPSEFWLACGVLLWGILGLAYFWYVVSKPLTNGQASTTLKRPWLRWGVDQLSRVGKGVLQLQVVGEGYHYMGWAFLVATMGLLTILVSR